MPADSEVIRPKRVRFLDHEIELGLVLRRDIHKPLVVTDANLHEVVAAAVIVNDYSARDVQLPEMQFHKGKSFRTFGPVGPYLTLLDAGNVASLSQLRLTLTVNGTRISRDGSSVAPRRAAVASSCARIAPSCTTDPSRRWSGSCATRCASWGAPRDDTDERSSPPEHTPRSPRHCDCI